MSRTITIPGALALACLLGACDKIPSEFQGKWSCRTGQFEIGGSTITYTTPHSGRALSPGNFRAEVDEVKEMDGAKYVTLKKAPMGVVSLKRDGQQLIIDTAPCGRG